jgi:6-pyruvoyl tetrahydropterin synthase/QueD family protein
LKISKLFQFEASHILPLHTGKCSRLHGHSWRMTVTVEGPINPSTGFVVDYGELKRVVEPLVANLDHSHLGEGCAWTGAWNASGIGKEWWPPFGPAFYPSSENLCRKIFQTLQPLIKEQLNVRLFEVRIEETCTSAAAWTADDEFSA